MKKIYMWQEEWLNIYFKDIGAKLHFFQKVTSEFHDAFYTELFKQYTSFDSLPLSWKKEKQDTAFIISDLFHPNSSVLSYGCGLGYMEKNILERRSDLNIDFYDSSTVANRWLMNDIKDIKFFIDENDFKQYDYILVSQVFTLLGTKDIKDLILRLKPNLKENGKIISINTSSIDIENGNMQSGNIFSALKANALNFIRPFYYFLFRYGRMQFWGWLRDNKTYKNIFNSCGYNIVHETTVIKQSVQLYVLDQDIKY